MADEYDSTSVEVLTLPEAVRKRPGMYFGEINGLAVNTLIFELVANSIDQFLASKASKVKLLSRNNTIVVSDDGPGLPFDRESVNQTDISLAGSYMVGNHNTPTADNHAPHVHLSTGSGLGGLGLAVVNAACKRIDVTSSNGKSIYKQSFGRGKILSKVAEESCSDETGTKFELLIDPEVFEGYSPDYSNLRKTMFELAHFYPGLIVEYQDERFIAEQGLLDLAYIYYENDSAFKREVNPAKFYYHGKRGATCIQVAAIGNSNDQTLIRSWVNGSPSVEGGTHTEGLIDALSEVNWSPKIALIQVIMHEPRYAGPSRDALRNSETKEIVRELLSLPLSKFTKK